MNFENLEIDTVLRIQDIEIKETGGLPGVRDMNVLESALSRPLTISYYRNLDIYEAAAYLASSIARTHPFNDANKRTALMMSTLFMACNNVKFNFTKCSKTAAADTMVALAKGEINEEEFAKWLQLNSSSQIEPNKTL